MAHAAQMTIKGRFKSSTEIHSINSFCVNFSLKGIPVLNKFVARDTEMARLVEVMRPSFTDRTRRKICVLHGLGRIGKTQLAIEFARTYCENYSAVFWTDSSSKEKLKQSIASLANQLPQQQLLERAKLYAQKPHKEIDGAVEDVLSWVSQSSNKQWLLIYDNLDREISTETSDPEAINLKEYLPAADQGYILISSRLTNLWHLRGENIRVGRVSELQGKIILTDSIEEPVRDSQKLISILQGLPLATNQAGAYIRSTGTTVLAYIKEYNKAWSKLMETQHRFAYQGPLDQSVLTTWTPLFERLEERSGHAAKLLILWGFLDNHDIWGGLFTPALTLTVDLELPSWYANCVEDYSNFMDFSVHLVLHQWCFQTSKADMAEMAWLASVLIASSAPKNRIADYRLVQRRLLPHCDRVRFLLREIIPKAPSNKTEELLDNAYFMVGNLYIDQGKLKAAEDMFVRALAGFEKALGPKHTLTLDTVNNLGILYRDQGKLRLAEDCYVRALAGYEKALGPEHTSTLRSTNNLGNLYSDQSKLREAEDMYVRALAGYEKALGPEHKSTLRSVNNLGRLYSKLREAEDM